MNIEGIEQAIKESRINMENNFQNGGPFGAAIMKDGKLIAAAHNTVLESKDATAHAEVNVIRKASQILGTHDLSGCILYTSTEPCPMCLSAIIWANIKEVYYTNTRKDAKEIGFRDDMIYEYLKNPNSDLLKLSKIENEEAKEVFQNFKDQFDKKIY